MTRVTIKGSDGRVYTGIVQTMVDYGKFTGDSRPNWYVEFTNAKGMPCYFKQQCDDPDATVTFEEVSE